MFSSLGHNLPTSEVHGQELSRVEIPRIQTSMFSLPPLSSSTRLSHHPPHTTGPHITSRTQFSPTKLANLSPSAGKLVPSHQVFRGSCEEEGHREAVVENLRRDHRNIKIKNPQKISVNLRNPMLPLEANGE